MGCYGWLVEIPLLVGQFLSLINRFYVGYLVFYGHTIAVEPTLICLIMNEGGTIV